MWGSCTRLEKSLNRVDGVCKDLRRKKSCTRARHSREGRLSWGGGVPRGEFPLKGVDVIRGRFKWSSPGTIHNSKGKLNFFNGKEKEPQISLSIKKATGVGKKPPFPSGCQKNPLGKGEKSLPDFSRTGHKKKTGTRRI